MVTCAATRGDGQAKPAVPPELPDAESWSALEILAWADARYRENVARASAFGAEWIALIDMAAEAWGRPRVFVVDTLFLFPETYRLIEQVERRYQISVERRTPALSPEAQERAHGPELWRRDPDLCCALRKLEPLQKKLDGQLAWVTAIRRDQTLERSTARKIQWDERFGVVKVNPLADWSQRQTWDYIRKHSLPYNPLYDRHYSSIGCTHCTRPVAPGEPPRAGRWPGQQKRECGLHARTPATASLSDG
jgi:phosphoadenosine phosphosulfate reductase